MIRFLNAVAVLAALALAMGFASLNAGQRVTLDLGFVVLQRVPLTVIAFASLLSDRC